MLKEYRSKRDFSKTPEPKKTGIVEKSIFVIQKHNATRLHFDFRIEYEGVLKSWAVPKGLSDEPNDRRLAIMVEDHPLSYANFSGTIPKGEYGAGTVEIWDKGRYVNITVKDGAVLDLGSALVKGHFTLFMKGKKINGTFDFVRTDAKNWLIMKKHEPQKVENKVIVQGHTIVITNPKKELDKNLTKYELVKYYQNISSLMLRHVKGRFISMLRFPDGVGGKRFFQKNRPDYFPKFLGTKCLKDKEGETCYAYVTDKAGLVYLGGQVVEIHIMINALDRLPNKMVFDLDPSVTDLKALKDAARLFRDFLGKIGLKPYIMTSGGKGYHIAVPIKEELGNKEVRDFAFKIADVLVQRHDNLTLAMGKSGRKGRILIDVNRNSESQTSIAPYGARARPGLPVACPFEWDELVNIDPQTFTIRNAPKTDAWKDFYRHAVSLKKILKKLSGRKG